MSYTIKVNGYEVQCDTDEEFVHVIRLFAPHLAPPPTRDSSWDPDPKLFGWLKRPRQDEPTLTDSARVTWNAVDAVGPDGATCWFKDKVLAGVVVDHKDSAGMVRVKSDGGDFYIHSRFVKPIGETERSGQQGDPFPVGTEVEWDDAMALNSANEPFKLEPRRVQGIVASTPADMPYGHPSDIYVVERSLGDGGGRCRVARHNLKAKVTEKPDSFAKDVVDTLLRHQGRQSAFDPTGIGARQARLGGQVWWDEGKLFGTPLRIVSGKLLGYESNGCTRVERDEEYGGGVYYVPESDIHDLGLDGKP